MDTVAEIITMLREQTNTRNTTDLPDARILAQMQVVYQRVYTALNDVIGDGEVKEQSINLVGGQYAYSLSILGDNSDVEFRSETNVYIKENDTWVELPYVSIEYGAHEQELAKNAKWYTILLDSSSPTSAITKQIYVYPTPTTSITGGLRIKYRVYPTNLTTSTGKTGIKLPRDMRDLLFYGTKAWIYGFKGQVQLKQEAKSEYEAELQRSLSYLDDKMRRKTVSDINDDAYHQTRLNTLANKYW